MHFQEDDCLFYMTNNDWYKYYTDSQYEDTKKYYVVDPGGKCVFAYSCNNFDSYILSVYELIIILNHVQRFMMISKFIYSIWRFLYS